MGRHVMDLTGKKFGNLVVLGLDHMDKYHKAWWLCRCSCGTEKAVSGGHLIDGSTTSCGCVMRSTRVSHGESRTRLYGIWAAMKSRCYNPKNNRYALYGGRGITVCEEWLRHFTDFRDWALDNGYRDDLSIDRIDTNKGYSPDNCRWATMKMQANNKRNNYSITYNGKTQTSEEWAQELDINGHTLRKRLNSGMSIKEAFTTPLHRSEKLLEYKGEVRTQADWGRVTGLGEVLRNRLRSGWSLEKAIETPVNENRTKTKGLPVTYNGDTMPLKELCVKYGKNYHSIQSRLQRGWTLEEAMSTPASDGHHSRKKGKRLVRTATV